MRRMDSMPNSARERESSLRVCLVFSVAVGQCCFLISIGRRAERGAPQSRSAVGRSERTAPVGFRDIRLSFELDTDEPQDRIDTLLRLTERYCVVLQTLRSQPPVAATAARRTG